jgi:hypothetical protein
VLGGWIWENREECEVNNVSFVSSCSSRKPGMLCILQCAEDAVIAVVRDDG